MTLRPHPAHYRFVGVDGPGYPVDVACANPDCDKPAENAHHVWSRKQISGAWDWVLDLDTGDLIPNKIGLCGSGTTGCHGKVTGGLGGHDAHVRYLDDEKALYWIDLRTSEGSPIESFAPGSVVERAEWLRALGRAEEADRLEAVWVAR